MKVMTRAAIILPFLYIVLALVIRGVQVSNIRSQTPDEVRITVQEDTNYPTVSGSDTRRFKGPCGEYCIYKDGDRFKITGKCGKAYDSVVYEPDTNTFFITR